MSKEQEQQVERASIRRLIRDIEMLNQRASLRLLALSVQDGWEADRRERNEELLWFADDLENLSEVARRLTGSRGTLA
jgi:hypothetical protein